MKTNKFPSFTQLLRHGIQLAAFILYPGLFIATFAAVRNLVMNLLAGTFSLTVLGPQLLLILAVFPITILWGRFFCGYLCAFGTMGDLLYYMGRTFLIKQFKIKPLRISPTTERWLKGIKYVGLVLIVGLLWVAGLKIDSAMSPWSAFGLLVAGNISLESLLSVGFAFLILIMLASLLIERFFCRYLCPLGAIFAVSSLGRLFKIKRDTTTCNGCTRCSRTCSMGLTIHNTDTVRSGDCINCMKCLDSCAPNSLTTTTDAAITGTTAALATLGLVYGGKLAGNLLLTSAATGTVSQTASATTPRGPYATDGTFTGSGNGFRGNTEVEVTVENGYITKIDVLSYRDDAEFFQKAQNSIIGAIIQTQSTDVDAVSGATFSSDGIMAAVKAAVDSGNAGGTTASGTAAGGAGSENEGEAAPNGASATENTPADNTQKESGQSDQSQVGQNDSSQTNNNRQSENSTSTTTKSLDLSKIEDGVYNGTGNGFRGSTEVQVTVKDHQITDISIVSYNDDQPFFEKASPTIISRILAGQSLDVDAVSGATFSGNGILAAVANALNVEYANPNSQSGG